MTAVLKFELFEEELLAPLRGHALSADEEFVASALLEATTERPLTIKAIRRLATQVRSVNMSERLIKRIIRSLRKQHEFPILSRKGSKTRKVDGAGNVTVEAKPPGYWWCHSEAEMNEFIGEFSKQPLDELHTLSRMVKPNYPRLVGQLTIADAAMQSADARNL